MSKYSVERASSPDDPTRCWGVRDGSQCNNKQSRNEEGKYVSRYCPSCGGNSELEKDKKNRLLLYRKNILATTIEAYATDARVKDLRSEIGLVRALLEARLELIRTPLDLIAATAPIGQLVDKIQLLVNSCDKIDRVLGVTINKEQVVQYAETLVNIITRAVDDADIAEELKEQILTQVGRGIENLNEPNDEALPGQDKNGD